MYKYRRIIVSVIAGILVMLLIGGIIISAHAESSTEIKKKIEALKQQQTEIEKKQKELKNEISQSQNEIMDLVEQKAQIDRQIELTQESIETQNDLIQEYNLLIAEKQNELDEALQAHEDLNVKYRARIRSMEENGKLTYWSILFKANSFADLLDRVDTINEIARADANMLAKLQESARQIEASRQELAAEKISLEEAKDELAQEEANLVAQREESDRLFAELWADNQALEAAAAKYDKQKEDVLAQIAKSEQAYKDQVAAEEKARKDREAKERAAAAARAAQERQNNSTGNSGSNTYTASKYGFIWPSYCHAISDYFGPRYHPITHTYSNHSGIDIKAAAGTAIYACASGRVSTASFGTAYGYHVVINHGNGFSTLYGHMTRYIVKEGDYVSQGQVIGYVGSTGWSTAPHLHLTMYYNGSLVNPLAYLP